MKRLLLLLSLSIAMLTPAIAQTQATAGKIAPPVAPLLLSYRYWPDHFIQWIGEELPYSMIEAYVDTTGSQPAFDLVLSERGTQKRLHFTNQQELVAMNKALGNDAVLTNVKYTPADTEGNGATYSFQFTGPEGKPVQWRFVQGSDVTERAAGLTDMSRFPVPFFMYREQGAVAGQGSALQVGDKVSEADVWKEISQPPYFVAYHGAHTVGLDIAILRPGDEEWKIDSAPESLSKGATWKLSTAEGRHRTFEVKQISGETYTFLSSDERTPAQHMAITAKKAGAGWAIDSIRAETDAKPDQHGFTVRFLSPLPVNATASAPEVKFELFAAKKNKVGSGTLSLSGEQPAQTAYLWEMKTPDWMQKKSISEELHYEGNAVAVKAALKQ